MVITFLIWVIKGHLHVWKSIVQLLNSPPSPLPVPWLHQECWSEGRGILLQVSNTREDELNWLVCETGRKKFFVKMSTYTDRCVGKCGWVNVLAQHTLTLYSAAHMYYIYSGAPLIRTPWAPKSVLISRMSGFQG